MNEVTPIIENPGMNEIIVGILSLVSIYIGYAVKNAKINLRSRKIKLYDHRIFANLRLTIKEVEAWEVPENKVVFKDALLIKLRTWLNSGLDFAKELQAKKLRTLDLEREFMVWYEFSVNKYNAEWKALNIPQNVIIFMNDELQAKLDNFTSKIYSISKSEQFINNYIRANVIFETLDTLLAETKADFLTIAFLKDLNGRFIKDTYKGVSVSDVQVA
ncbi:MAG: hypothetical protein L3J35_10310 [Bacteroidales bacterium]|nr:hypothetical protein [Bacteroidales bacterium]